MSTSHQELLWSEPVKFEISAGGNHKVIGPKDALQWLEDRWPASSGSAFETAKQECRLAQKSGSNLDSARQAFVEAALEAFMIVRE